MKSIKKKLCELDKMIANISTIQSEHDKVNDGVNLREFIGKLRGQREMVASQIGKTKK
jgi:hypothetical protein